MVMIRGPSCGPVARPKFALPTVPFTPKFVRLNMLDASARICNRIRLLSPFVTSATCLINAKLSLKIGGCRNLLLYCDEVPKEYCPGIENAAVLKYNDAELLGLSDVRLCPVSTAPPFVLHIRASVNRTPFPSVLGQVSGMSEPL